MDSHHTSVTGAPGKSTHRAGARAAKAALHIQILCPRLWVQDEIKEEEQMHNGLFTVYVKLQTLASSKEGQDLVEYALLCCLIALAVITGVNNVATAVMNVFTNVSSSLA